VLWCQFLVSVVSRRERKLIRQIAIFNSSDAGRSDRTRQIWSYPTDSGAVLCYSPRCRKSYAEPECELESRDSDEELRIVAGKATHDEGFAGVGGDEAASQAFLGAEPVSS
jgi:hypothetical protein